MPPAGCAEAAGLEHTSRRDPEQGAILRVAEHQCARRIEHGEPVRHLLQCIGQIFPAFRQLPLQELRCGDVAVERDETRRMPRRVKQRNLERGEQHALPIPAEGLLLDDERNAVLQDLLLIREKDLGHGARIEVEIRLADQLGRRLRLHQIRRRLIGNQKAALRVLDVDAVRQVLDGAAVEVVDLARLTQALRITLFARDGQRADDRTLRVPHDGDRDARRDPLAVHAQAAGIKTREGLA